MKHMYKYVIPVQGGDIEVDMPVNTVIQHIGNQSSGEICVWAEVPETELAEIRTFRTIGTGHEVPPMKFTYVGTVLDGFYVWHLYELTL